jgi:hypothetical protein
MLQRSMFAAAVSIVNLAAFRRSAWKTSGGRKLIGGTANMPWGKPKVLQSGASRGKSAKLIAAERTNRLWDDWQRRDARISNARCSPPRLRPASVGAIHRIQSLRGAAGQRVLGQK